MSSIATLIDHYQAEGQSYREQAHFWSILLAGLTPHVNTAEEAMAIAAMDSIARSRSPVRIAGVFPGDCRPIPWRKSSCKP